MEKLQAALRPRHKRVLATSLGSSATEVHAPNSGAISTALSAFSSKVQNYSVNNLDKKKSYASSWLCPHPNPGSPSHIPAQSVASTTFS